MVGWCGVEVGVLGMGMRWVGVTFPVAGAGAADLAVPSADEDCGVSAAMDGGERQESV